MMSPDEDEYMPYGRLMEFALRVIFVGLFVGIIYVAMHPSEPIYCPPEWQCVGPADTNHPNCKKCYE